MRKDAVLCIVLLMLPYSLMAAEDALRFRVYLRDKGKCQAPELSMASLDRRAKQGIFLDSTDYPISENYLNIIRTKNLPIVSQSRWMNTVVVSASDSSCLDILYSLPFVRSVGLVWINPNTKLSSSPGERSASVEKLSTDTSCYYGKADIQVKMLGLEPLHNAGFKGAGKMIAVVDAGFIGIDTMSWSKNLNLVAAKDFIYPPTSVYESHWHGASVLSTMAANKDYTIVGTAPEANYCLLRSEDINSEFPIEEDYWIAAVEYADSIGADIVTSSLGYNLFDFTALSYNTSQLDGKTAFISQAAAIAATKGLLIVCSAGNDRNTSWQKINFPADVKDVLTVGAVQSDETVSSFSSVGPTSDHRIKPDVMALGSGTAIINMEGEQTTGNGSSYTAPLVAGMAACLWEAFPQLKATELLQWIKKSGNKASEADTIYGYGIPNASKAWLLLEKSFSGADSTSCYCYPNPAKDKLFLVEPFLSRGPVRIIIYSPMGLKVMEKTVNGFSGCFDISFLPGSIYFIEFIVGKERKAFQKLIVQR